MATGNLGSAGQITSADCIFFLGITNVYPNPLQLQQFAADDIFESEQLTPAEFIMGADGYLTGGFVNVPTPMTIAFNADSPSIQLFDTWYLYQKQNQTIAWAFGTVAFPSLGKKFTLDRGGLRNYRLIADPKKVLQPPRYTIVWQNPAPAAISPPTYTMPPLI